jgi:hypothetical protein
LLRRNSSAAISDQSQGSKSEIPTPPNLADVTLLPGSTGPVAAPTEEIMSDKSSPQGNDVAMKFASESHDYVREYIRNADQKAIFYFSICSALLAFEHTQGWSQHWIRPPSLWSAADLLCCIAMVGLAAAASSFLWVVMPRLGGSPRGLIFFKSVATYSSGDDYVSDVVKRSESELTAEKLRHCHELARVAVGKFSALALGLRIGGVAIICSLFLLLALQPPSPSILRSSEATTQQSK